MLVPGNNIGISATAAEFKTACCTAPAATPAAASCTTGTAGDAYCRGLTNGGGSKYNTLAVAGACTGGAGTCTLAQCCVTDTTLCRSYTCTTANKYVPAALYSTLRGANPDTTCCTETKGTCAAAQCSADQGWTLNTAAARCATNACASNTAACCVVTPTSCRASVLACSDSDKYKVVATALTATTQDTFDTNCCTGTKAICASDFNCDSGTIPLPGNTVLGGAFPRCTSSTVASCTDTNCCETIYGNCAYQAQQGTACNAATFLDATKYAVVATTATFQANCCTTKVTCSATPTCSAGFKARTNLAAISCVGAACTNTECCIADTTTCGGSNFACAANTYLSNAAATTLTQAGCCSAQANCGSITCDATYSTQNANSATTFCGGATCSIAQCCTAIPTKCAGSVAYTCPVGYYNDGAFALASGAYFNAAHAVNDITINAVQNQQNYNTQCCQAVTTCAAYLYATGVNSDAAAVRPALVTVAIGAVAGVMASMM